MQVELLECNFWH